MFTAPCEEAASICRSRVYGSVRTYVHIFALLAVACASAPLAASASILNAHCGAPSGSLNRAAVLSRAPVQSQMTVLSPLVDGDEAARTTGVSVFF